jgi:hypothetical protein
VLGAPVLWAAPAVVPLQGALSVDAGPPRSGTEPARSPHEAPRVAVAVDVIGATGQEWMLFADQYSKYNSTWPWRFRKNSAPCNAGRVRDPFTMT